MTVRTRVAPSPTGDPHVGTAYMALFSLVFARHHGGKFVLRIEDTDRARSTGESEQAIVDALRWLGLDWDEGPDIGGPHGPYRQSERRDIYRAHVEQLLADGHAFHCFCTTERLNAMRAEQMQRGETSRYDGTCLRLSPAETRRRLDAGETSVVRMVVPDSGTCMVPDELRGDIAIDWAQVDMQVLMKADGLPTYHLAVVVDDHLMQITHVLRGEEWINSAPKHILLYQYFGWPMPQLIHLPLLRNPDRSKLSKRKNPTGINYYRRMGFLPEALLNYLGRMGFSLPDEEEKFPLQRMVDEFSLQRLSLGAPVFDVGKLAWLNGRWIREDLDERQFAERLMEWALNPQHLKRFVPLIRERVETLSDVVPMTSFLLAGNLDIAEQDFAGGKLQADDMRRVLQFVIWRLDAGQPWNSEALAADLRGMAEQLDIRIRDFLYPLFIAVTGKPVSPPLFDSMALLGPDMTRARLRHALDVLGGVSKKQAKKLEKEFRGLTFADDR